MKSKTKIDAERNILECTLEGQVDIGQSLKITQEVFNQAQESKLNILYDVRRLSVGALFLPVYGFYQKLSSPVEPFKKIAFLCPPEDYELSWTLYENAMTFTGLWSKVFTQIEEALRFLC